MDFFEERPAQKQVLPISGILYRVCDRGGRSPRLLVSGTEFDRELLRIERAAEDAVTAIFPNTARGALEGAFENSSLRSAVLNEGLKRLGGCEDEDDSHHERIFRNAGIRQVTLPSTLRVLGDRTFDACRRLEKVVFRRQGPAGASEAALETHCGEIEIPATLEKVGRDAFDGCSQIRTVWAEDSFVREGLMKDRYGSLTVLPWMTTKVGDALLRNLRSQKEVTIPDGVKVIGEHWFENTDIESVEIPASVREIGSEVFQGCTRLRRVEFKRDAVPSAVAASMSEIVSGGSESQPGESRLRTIESYAFCGCRSLRDIQLPDGLETIGICCFSYSGLEELVLPPGVREIRCGAFSYCDRLRRVRLNEGLERLNAEETVNGRPYEGCVFASSAVREISLPSTLKEAGGDPFIGCEGLRVVLVRAGCAVDVAKYVRDGVEVRREG